MTRTPAVDARLRLVLEFLADGQFHSGERLGQRLGMSRAALWKVIQALVGHGVPIESVRGRGYRLPAPVELLDPQRVARNLGPPMDLMLPVGVVLSTGSTNTDLLERARHASGPQALLAEVQLGGRGRWGRHWVSGFGAGIYLSLLWRFPVLPGGLAGFSAACAIAVAQALRAEGADCGVKWPNDIVCSHGKLGGILVEVVGEPTGPCAVVVGLGINVRAPATRGDGIDQPAAGLQDILSRGESLGRNHLAGDLLRALADACAVFSEHGFAAFWPRWAELDVLMGQEVTLSLPDRMHQGTVEGIDERGALCLRTPEGSLRLFSGELARRVRRAPAD